nr:IAP-3 [Calliteara abietis nucleopolyhedrovirus]
MVDTNRIMLSSLKPPRQCDTYQTKRHHQQQRYLINNNDLDKLQNNNGGGGGDDESGDSYSKYMDRYESLPFNLCLAMSKHKLANMGWYFDCGAYKCVYCEALETGGVSLRNLKQHQFTAACPKSIATLRLNNAVRKKSFLHCSPAHSSLRSRSGELARCGFYFDSKLLETRCCYCSLVIENLNSGIRVECIHEKCSPTCVFSKQRVGSVVANAGFVPTIEPSAPPAIDIDDDYDRNDNNFVEEQKHLFDQLEAAAAAPEPNDKKIYPELKQTIGARDATIVGSNTLLNVDVNSVVLMGNSNIPTPNDNNNDSSNMCAICFVERKQICYLPCGHVVVCTKCALRCVTCCICRSTIEQQFKVYF